MRTLALFESPLAIPGFFETSIQPLQSIADAFNTEEAASPTLGSRSRADSQANEEQTSGQGICQDVDPPKEFEQRPASYTRKWWICGDLLWNSGRRICWNNKWEGMEGERKQLGPWKRQVLKIAPKQFLHFVLSLFWEPGFAMTFPPSSLKQTSNSLTLSQHICTFNSSSKDPQTCLFIPDPHNLRHFDEKFRQNLHQSLWPCVSLFSETILWWVLGSPPQKIGGSSHLVDYDPGGKNRWINPTYPTDRDQYLLQIFGMTKPSTSENSTSGGFPAVMGYKYPPVIIHFHKIVHCKPSTLGYHHDYGTPPMMDNIPKRLPQSRAYGNPHKFLVYQVQNGTAGCLNIPE